VQNQRRAAKRGNADEEEEGGLNTDLDLDLTTEGEVGRIKYIHIKPTYSI
jgi:hypothetical protein